MSPIKPSCGSHSSAILLCYCLQNTAGFLLFWQSLILILLEGCPSDLAQYLYLARTVCVDVDASGRKVGEAIKALRLTERKATACVLCGAART
jgi:hypothetical protein